MKITTWQYSQRLLTALAAVLLLIIPAIAQTIPVIKVDRLKGAVEVLHAEDTDAAWEAAVTGQEIGPGWRLRTGTSAKVQLVFPRDNVVILKENSVLYVDKLDLGGGATLEASEGSLLVDLKNALAPGSEFELETPTALAVVRGTKYGAEDITDDNVMFYGYSGVVDIFDASQLYDAVKLKSGYLVEVPFAEPPTQPVPFGQAGSDFVEDAENDDDFLAAEAALAPILARLGHILLNLEDKEELLGNYESEWTRYEHDGQVNKLLVLYVQALALGELVNQTADNFGYLTTADPALSGLLGDDMLAFDPYFEDFDATEFSDRAEAYMSYNEELTDRFGSGAGPLGIGLILKEITGLLADIYSRLYDFVEDAEPYIGDNEDIIDDLRGTIPPGDPTLGVRGRPIDTDGDGVSDVDELGLDTDPTASNDSEGFIVLVAPDDGESVDYPETDSVSFEFEPLESSMVIGYDLLVEADGHQWLRRDVMYTEDVDLRLLVGPGAPFASNLAADGEVTLSWLVAAILDESSLVGHISSSKRVAGLGGVPNVTSETRELTITMPVSDTPPETSLSAMGSTMVDVGETFTIRASITDAAAIGEWEFTLVYDPSIIAFETGRRLGLFSATTLFFGEHSGGVLTVSGSDTRGGTGVSGDGDIFELEFIGESSGSTTIELSEITLTDILGNDITSEMGGSVDIDVY